MFVDDVDQPEVLELIVLIDRADPGVAPVVRSVGAIGCRQAGSLADFHPCIS